MFGSELIGKIRGTVDTKLKRVRFFYICVFAVIVLVTYFTNPELEYSIIGRLWRSIAYPAVLSLITLCFFQEVFLERLEHLSNEEIGRMIGLYSLGPNLALCLICMALFDMPVITGAIYAFMIYVSFQEVSSESRCKVCKSRDSYPDHGVSTFKSMKTDTKYPLEKEQGVAWVFVKFKEAFTCKTCQTVIYEDVVVSRQIMDRSLYQKREYADYKVEFQKLKYLQLYEDKIRLNSEIITARIIIERYLKRDNTASAQISQEELEARTALLRKCKSTIISCKEELPAINEELNEINSALKGQKRTDKAARQRAAAASRSKRRGSIKGVDTKGLTDDQISQLSILSKDVSNMEHSLSHSEHNLQSDKSDLEHERQELDRYRGMNGDDNSFLSDISRCKSRIDSLRSRVNSRQSEYQTAANRYNEAVDKYNNYVRSLRR